MFLPRIIDPVRSDGASRDHCLEEGEADPVDEKHERPTVAQAAISVGMLLVALLAVVGLTKL